MAEGDMTDDAKAVPRDPTEEMERAACSAVLRRCTPLKHEQYRLYVRKIWRAMYDAAPEPKEAP
jgi:hypothetical protein